MSTVTHLIEIRDELRKQNQELGFGHPPKARYIYANRQYPDCLWYFWDGSKNAYHQIEHHALTCVIEKLEIEQKEFRGKPDVKVNLHVRADRKYIIQAGYDTLFAKGLLYALSQLPKAAFVGPITIAVEPGDTEQVLFCRIYDSAGNSVYAPYPEQVDWPGIVQTVMEKISGKASKTSIDADPDPIENQPLVISQEQAKRLFAISRKAGLQTDALKLLIGDYQYISTKDIASTDYQKICKAATDPKLVSAYNAKLKTDDRIPVGTW